MAKKVVMFIDGQNFYNALKAINLKETQIDFDKLFKGCLKHNEVLLSALLFRPLNVNSFKINKRTSADHILNSMIQGDRNGYSVEELNQWIDKINKGEKIKILPTELKEQVDLKFNNANKWLKNTNQYFSESQYKYKRLEKKYDDLNIKFIGVLKVDPYKEKMIGEKGVDVALSVSMVSMAIKNQLDKVILFSGDLDLVSGVAVCKENNKEVYIVKLHKGSPPKNINSSRELLSSADGVIDIYESELKEKYKK